MVVISRDFPPTKNPLYLKKKQARCESRLDGTRDDQAPRSGPSLLLNSANQHSAELRAPRCRQTWPRYCSCYEQITSCSNATLILKARNHRMANFVAQSSAASSASEHYDGRDYITELSELPSSRSVFGILE